MTCKDCGQEIFEDRDGFRTADGDYGCDYSPETCEEGVGSHDPVEAE